MGCWSGFACLKPRKGGRRIVPAARMADGAASSSQAWVGARQPAPGAAPTLSPSLLAPPSSPASFQNSAVHSSAQSPSLHVTRQVETTAMMFQTGPYAHETALVTPPVFSTFTTAPSTAPFTPPPELAHHITTPSSPEVPFAQLLTSSLNVKGPVRQQSDTTTASSTAPFTPPPELAQATTPSSPEVPFAQLLTSSFAVNATVLPQSDGTTASSTAPVTPPPEPGQATTASFSPEVPFAQLLTSTFSVKGAAREADVIYSASPFASPDYCVSGDMQAVFELHSNGHALPPLTSPSGSVGLVELTLQRISGSPLPVASFPILEPETWVELEVKSSNRSSQELVRLTPSEPETSLFTICHANDLLRPDYVPQLFEEGEGLATAETLVRSHSGQLDLASSGGAGDHLPRVDEDHDDEDDDDDERAEEDYLVLEGFHLDSNYHGGFHDALSREKSEDQRQNSGNATTPEYPLSPPLHPKSPQLVGSNGSPHEDSCLSPRDIVLEARDDTPKVKQRLPKPQECQSTGAYTSFRRDLAMDGAVDGAMEGAVDGAMEGAVDGAMVGAVDGAMDGDVLVGSLPLSPSIHATEHSPPPQQDTAHHPPPSNKTKTSKAEAVSPRYGRLVSKCEELALALQMAEAREREALQLLDMTQKKANSLEESVARLSVELTQQELAFMDLQSRHFAHLGVSSPNHMLTPGFNLVA